MKLATKSHKQLIKNNEYKKFMKNIKDTIINEIEDMMQNYRKQKSVLYAVRN